MAETTRMALRAAAAAAIAMIATRAVAMPRSYWAVLVAVVLVAETWGDSVRMAIQRFAMTALGGVVGALLHAAVAPYHGLEAVLLFAGVWLAVYFRRAASGGSYPWMVFFVTVYVVFLFAILGAWSVRGILLVRIADTGVGCAAGLAASLLVSPRAAGERLDAELRALWSACRALVVEACRGAGAALDAQEIVASLEALRVRAQATAYERPLSGARRRVAARVDATDALCHASISLARALAEVRDRSLPAGIGDVVCAARRRALEALAALAAATPGDAAPAPEGGERAYAVLADGRLGHDDFVLVGRILAHAEDVRLHAAALRENLGRT